MKRLGKYSGMIYTEEEAANMEECGIMLPDSKADDKSYIAAHHQKDLEHCIICMGCPMAQKKI